MTSNSLIINTLMGNGSPGSRQSLHFYKSVEERDRQFQDHQVNDEFDHSFVFLANDKSADVRWKNKAGEIQFCGSGAYALSWFLLQDPERKKIAIQSRNLKLSAYQDEQGTCFLIMPNKICEKVGSEDEGDVYYNEESGIYLHHLNTIETLKNQNYVDEKLADPKYKNRHGLCLFYWDQALDLGSLRYFTPWHGRDEDYVTGSIHQYLTPLVFKLTSQKDQRWQQLSSSPGSLQSRYDRQEVLIFGSCDEVS